MADRSTSDLPSPFVVQWTAAVAPALPGKRRVLDVAMGRGRHARFLSELDVAVYGVDRDFDAVRSVVREAAARGRIVRGWCADLTAFPLPRRAFEMVVVTRYLQRDLMHAIRRSGRAGRNRPLRDVHDPSAGPWHRTPVARPSSPAGRASRTVQSIRVVVLRGSDEPGSRGAARCAETALTRDQELELERRRASARPISRSYSSRGNEVDPDATAPCDWSA